MSADKKLRIVARAIIEGAVIVASTIFIRGASAQLPWGNGSGATGFAGLWVGTTSDEQIDKSNPKAILNPNNATNYADRRQLLVVDSGSGYNVNWDLANETISDEAVRVRESARTEQDNGFCSSVRQGLKNPSLSQNCLRIHIDGSYSNGGHPVTYIDTMCCFLQGQVSMKCYSAARYWLDGNWWYDGHWDVVMRRQQSSAQPPWGPPATTGPDGLNQPPPFAEPTPGDSGF
jgi:hypothetical protein